MRELTSGNRLDQYEITEVLRRGAMSDLFKAIEVDSGLAVVLKVPKEELEGDLVFYERFLREGKIGRLLDHPGIVRFLTPREQSRLYHVMEYVPGDSLRALLGSGWRVPAEQALAIGCQLCGVLSYLHERGVVHRDLKPENVILVPPAGTVKLVDFGIAFLESARRLTWPGLSQVFGTPDYMAPEQIRGRRGDPSTDVYALGTMLFELITGRLPFEAENAAALLHAKVHDDPTPVRVHAPEVPEDLCAVVARALAREPRDRYASAADLLFDLTDPGRRATRSKAVIGPGGLAWLRRWRRRALSPFAP